jgi:hypothetical protein
MLFNDLLENKSLYFDLPVKIIFNNTFDDFFDTHFKNKIWFKNGDIWSGDDKQLVFITYSLIYGVLEIWFQKISNFPIEMRIRYTSKGVPKCLLSKTMEEEIEFIFN